MRLSGLAVFAAAFVFSIVARAESSNWPWYLETTTNGHIYLGDTPNKEQCQAALRKLLIRPLTAREQREQDNDLATKMKFVHANGCTGYQIEPGTAGSRMVDGIKICHIPPCCQWAPEVYKDFMGQPVIKARCIQAIK